ncbi:hypothetical protein AOLI_G00313700 [Acnodon oligacanthus]
MVSGGPVSRRGIFNYSAERQVNSAVTDARSDGAAAMLTFTKADRWADEREAARPSPPFPLALAPAQAGGPRWNIQSRLLCGFHARLTSRPPYLPLNDRPLHKRHGSQC